MNRSPISRRILASVCALIACTLALSLGCSDQTDFTYGKTGDRSVNGVSVFANFLRQRGHSVSRKRRLTKRMKRFDTIVWAPDNADLPPENVAAWMEDWLAGGVPRVLIYVGRSYEGKLPFHRSMVEVSSPEEREKWQRELSDVVINKGTYDQWMFDAGNTNNAFWFEEEKDLRLDTTKLDGAWAEGIDATEVELDCETLLKPMDSYNEDGDAPQLTTVNQSEATTYDSWANSFRDEELNVTELLSVDGKPFAFEIASVDSPDRKLIVISNGSFLLNFPLANAEHRKLASKVADEVKGDVVFLESSYRWPTIGGQANDPALRWTWVGQAPMNYIVPHFLFWGVLYCFVFFPNFGRPKRIQFHPPKAFRSHVQAVASILGRSKEKSWARSVIDTWLKRINKTKS